MEPKLDQAVQAIDAFVDTMRPVDDFFMLRLSNDVELVLDYTNDKEAFRRAASRLRARGGWLVPPGEGAAGAAATLAGILVAGVADPPLSPDREPRGAAERHIALYRSLGLLSGEERATDA